MPVSLMSLADGRDLLIVFLSGSTCLFGSRKIKGLLWIGRKTPRVPIWVLQPEPHRSGALQGRDGAIKDAWEELAGVQPVSPWGRVGSCGSAGSGCLLGPCNLLPSPHPARGSCGSCSSPGVELFSGHSVTRQHAPTASKSCKTSAFSRAAGLSVFPVLTSKATLHIGRE